MRRARSHTMSQSGRLPPTGSMALRTRCTLRSLLVKVPSFSANVVAGSTTSAISAVSCMKMSCTTRNSRLLNAFSAWCRSGSLSSGFSPVMYMAFSRPSSAAATMSVTTMPAFGGSRLFPHAASNLRTVSGPMRWYPVNELGMHPASPQPCTLFWPLRGETPLPGLPICPVASARFRSAWTFAVPLVCCVIPMPQIRHEPLNGGFAYMRAASAICDAGTPVIFSA